MNGKQRKYLRGLAHSLRPAVNLGARGLAESVVRHLDGALTDHELIKVKVGGDCPLDREQVAAELHQQLGCEVAGSIGHVVILYRRHPETPHIQVPDSGESEPGDGGDSNGGVPCPTTNA